MALKTQYARSIKVWKLGLASLRNRRMNYPLIFLLHYEFTVILLQWKPKPSLIYELNGQPVMLLFLIQQTCDQEIVSIIRIPGPIWAGTWKSVRTSWGHRRMILFTDFVWGIVITSKSGSHFSGNVAHYVEANYLHIMGSATKTCFVWCCFADETFSEGRVYLRPVLTPTSTEPATCAYAYRSSLAN